MVCFGGPKLPWLKKYRREEKYDFCTYSRIIIGCSSSTVIFSSFQNTDIGSTRRGQAPLYVEIGTRTHFLTPLGTASPVAGSSTGTMTGWPVSSSPSSLF